MQILPDYWFVYISPDIGGAEIPEVVAMSPQESWDRLGVQGRSLLAFAGAYFKRHPADRVVFLADVIAWIGFDCGLDWGALRIDLDEAFADIDRTGPALRMIVDSVALGVVIGGNRPLKFAAPGRPAIAVADHERQVRAELVRGISAHWHVARSAWAARAPAS